MLKSIDLFTGIGGMTLGLHGLAEPLLYCDIAQESRDVITRQISRGKLPPAPIANDVCQVDLSNIPGVQLISAGFPCVGFSVMGMKKAFDNAESGLFREVLRIRDSSRTPVPLIFLENVSNVLRIGMKEIVEELSVKRGYELRYIVVSAESMGAPHVRSRWFCLAVQPGFVFDFRASEYEEYPWTPEVARTIARTSRSTSVARSGLLGNSVVPDSVRYAFLYLASRFEAPSTLSVSEFSLEGTRTDVYTHPRKDVPKCGLVVAGTRCIIARPCPAAYRRALVPGPVIDPGTFESNKPPSPLMKTPLVRKVREMLRWSTPRHSLTGPCNYLTERSIRDLPTQVRFEVDTQDRQSPVSAEFIEFLMGFPIGWTL